MPDIDKNTMEEAVKEAIQEWLDNQMTKFGWWSFGTLLALALSGLVWLALIGQGWKK